MATPFQASHLAANLNGQQAGQQQQQQAQKQRHHQFKQENHQLGPKVASSGATSGQLQVRGCNLPRGNSVVTMDEQIYQHHNSIPARNRILQAAKSLQQHSIDVPGGELRASGELSASGNLSQVGVPQQPKQQTAHLGSLNSLQQAAPKQQKPLQTGPNQPISSRVAPQQQQQQQLRQQQQAAQPKQQPSSNNVPPVRIINVERRRRKQSASVQQQQQVMLHFEAAAQAAQQAEGALPPAERLASQLELRLPASWSSSSGSSGSSSCVSSAQVSPLASQPPRGSPVGPPASPSASNKSPPAPLASHAAASPSRSPSAATTGPPFAPAGSANHSPGRRRVLPVEPGSAGGQLGGVGAPLVAGGQQAGAAQQQQQSQMHTRANAATKRHRQLPQIPTGQPLPSWAQMKAANRQLRQQTSSSSSSSPPASTSGPTQAGLCAAAAASATAMRVQSFPMPAGALSAATCAATSAAAAAPAPACQLQPACPGSPLARQKVAAWHRSMARTRAASSTGNSSAGTSSCEQPASPNFRPAQASSAAGPPDARVYFTFETALPGGPLAQGGGAGAKGQPASCPSPKAGSPQPQRPPSNLAALQPEPAGQEAAGQGGAITTSSGRRLSSCGLGLRANFLMNKQHAVSEFTPPRSLESSHSRGSSDAASPLVWPPASPQLQQQQQGPPQPLPAPLQPEYQQQEYQQQEYQPQEYQQEGRPLVQEGGLAGWLAAGRQSVSAASLLPAGGQQQHTLVVSRLHQQQSPAHNARSQPPHSLRTALETGPRRPAGSASAAASHHGLPPRAASASETGAHCSGAAAGGPLLVGVAGVCDRPVGTPHCLGPARSMLAVQAAAGGASGGAWSAGSGSLAPGQVGEALRQGASLGGLYLGAGEQQQAANGRRQLPYASALSVDVYQQAGAQRSGSGGSIDHAGAGDPPSPSSSLQPHQQQQQLFGPQQPAPSCQTLSSGSSPRQDAAGRHLLSAQAAPQQPSQRASLTIPGQLPVPFGLQRDRQPSNVSTSSMPAGAFAPNHNPISPPARPGQPTSGGPSLAGSGGGGGAPSCSASSYQRRQASADAAVGVANGLAASNPKERRAAGGGQRKFGAWAERIAATGQQQQRAHSATQLGALDRPPHTRAGRQSKLGSSSSSSSAPRSPSCSSSASGARGRSSSSVSSSSAESQSSSSSSTPFLDTRGPKTTGRHWRAAGSGSSVGPKANGRQPKGAGQRRQSATQRALGKLSALASSRASRRGANPSNGNNKRGGVSPEAEQLTLDARLRLAENSASKLFRKVDLSPQRQSGAAAGSARGHSAGEPAAASAARGESAGGRVKRRAEQRLGEGERVGEAPQQNPTDEPSRADDDLSLLLRAVEAQRALSEDRTPAGGPQQQGGVVADGTQGAQAAGVRARSALGGVASFDRTARALRRAMTLRSLVRSLSRRTSSCEAAPSAGRAGPPTAAPSGSPTTSCPGRQGAAAASRNQAGSHAHLLSVASGEFERRRQRSADGGPAQNGGLAGWSSSSKPPLGQAATQSADGAKQGAGNGPWVAAGAAAAAASSSAPPGSPLVANLGVARKAARFFKRKSSSAAAVAGDWGSRAGSPAGWPPPPPAQLNQAAGAKSISDEENQLEAPRGRPSRFGHLFGQTRSAGAPGSGPAGAKTCAKIAGVSVSAGEAEARQLVRMKSGK